MARNQTIQIYGTYGNDMTVLDAAAVEAQEYSAWDWTTAETVNHIWSGNYSALDGDDPITRDRPGGYRGGISPNGSVSTLGDAFLYGGSGSDNVSYAMAAGAVHIDRGAAPGYGTAEAIGLHGVTIHAATAYSRSRMRRVRATTTSSRDRALPTGCSGSTVTTR
jgi:hypothetical protein